jgi:hypothetical protein
MNLFKAAIGTAVGTVARKQMSNRGLIGFGLGLTALRVATKSVPAAFLVGSGLVLTAYYKKSQAAEKTSVPDGASYVE